MRVVGLAGVDVRLGSGALGLALDWWRRSLLGGTAGTSLPPCRLLHRQHLLVHHSQGRLFR
jgi:hypothetical protein